MTGPDSGTCSRPIRDMRNEFGAGWDLTIPLTFSALGVERQVLVDIHRHVNLELVNGTIRRLRRRQAALERVAGEPVRSVGRPIRSADELASRFGIEYRAPCDARATGLPTGSVDFISSTSTLEHVPEGDLVSILAECRRLLSPDGVLSCRIDMRDHFSYSDPTVSPYNFLRYSARRWRLLNSRLLYQNRLRLPDYLRALEEAGFDIVSVDAETPGPQERAALGRLRVAAPFRQYAEEELTVGTAFVVARPSAGRGLAEEP